jgi:hypothetical protein
VNGFRSGISGILRGAVLVALAGGSLTAGAIEWRPDTDFVWQADSGKLTAFPGQGSGNVWGAGTKGVSAGGPTWSSPPKALPFNPSPTANFRAQFSAKGMAKAMFKPGVVIQLAAEPLIKAALDAACVHIAGGQMVLQDGAAYETCDMSGGAPVPTKQWRIYAVNNGGVGWETSRGAACSNAHAAEALQGMTNNAKGDPTYTLVGDAYDDPQRGCYFAQKATYKSGYTYTSGGYSLYETRTVSLPPPGPQPITATQAQAAVEQTLQQWTQADFLYGYQTHNTPELLSELVQTAGVEPSGVSADGTTTITEPAQSTTTQNADGTQTVTTKQVTHQVAYENPPASADGSPATNTTINITYNTTTHTQVTNIAADGTTTKGPDTTETKADKPKTDEPCLANPDTLGCAKFGTPDKGPDIPRDAKTVQFTPVQFASGSCPAPVGFTAFGQQYQFSYQPLCDKLQLVSALLLALSGLAAAYIFVEGLKV